MQTTKINKEELETAKKALEECRSGIFGNNGFKVLYDFRQRHNNDGGMEKLGTSGTEIDQLQSAFFNWKDIETSKRYSHEDLVKQFMRVTAEYGAGNMCVDVMQSANLSQSQILAREILLRLNESTIGRPKQFMPDRGNRPYSGGQAWIGLVARGCLDLKGPFDNPAEVIEDLVNNQGRPLAGIGLFVLADDQDERKSGDPGQGPHGGYFEALPSAGRLEGWPDATQCYTLCNNYGEPGWLPQPTLRRELHAQVGSNIELFAQRSFRFKRQVAISFSA